MNHIEEYARKFMTHSSHTILHVKRVYNLCNRIEGADKEILLTAALLHDIARDDEMKGIVKDHAIAGAERALKYLKSINYDENKAQRIASCIRTHRWRNNLNPNSFEGLILKEADKLDAIGAIGVIRTTKHNYDRLPYHPTDPLAKNREPDDHLYGLDHFFVKLLKLYDKFTIPEFKKEAKRRHEFMIYFLDMVEKGSSIEVINTIRENYMLKDYDEESPFLPSENYIVGKLMKLNNPVAINLIKELEMEI